LENGLGKDVEKMDATKAASISFKPIRVSFLSCAITIVKGIVKEAPLIDNGIAAEKQHINQKIKRGCLKSFVLLPIV